jgi:hypothetical protein
MSKPIFIWTMRRTGGTSLTTILTEMSEYPQIQHEPFNVDRQLGQYVKDYRSGVDHNILKKRLSEELEKTPTIKHCYEMFSKEFNMIILDVVCNKHYQHVFLKREDEISRIFSLYLAQQTSVWGPEQKKNIYSEIISGTRLLDPFDIDNMVEHARWCTKLTQTIKDELTKRNIIYKEVSFEDFYVGEDIERLGKLYSLFDYLEFSNETREKFKSEIDKKIFNSSQQSRDILEYIPNYKDALERLQTII